MSDTSASEAIAEAFHEAYERLAPSFGYRTREASAKPWADVPESNKRLMIAVVYNLLADDVIRAGTGDTCDQLQPTPHSSGGVS